jgi:hypothetical protein
MTLPITHTDAPAAFAGRVGAARRDITPPVGIYARSWGAAKADTASGVHRELTATAVAFASPVAPKPLLLVAIDHGFWKSPEDEWHVRGPLAEELGLPASNVLVCLSHTHSGPSVALADVDGPGGELVAAYRDTLRDAVTDAAREALEALEPAIVDWAYGWSDLARNRDLWAAGRFLCGYAPDGPADGTLLVGRVTAATGRTIATVVNYACHPTTLAWENQLLSPDWVGSMRETVEEAVGGVCVFMQGASGELAPREQHTSDTAFADKQGRQLGLAVHAAIAGMLPPGVELRFAESVESGAPLARWGRARFVPSQGIGAVTETVSLHRAEQVPLDSLRERWKNVGERALGERLERVRWQRQSLGDTTTIELPFWIWKLGDAMLVAHPGEAYAWFQQEVRRQLPSRTIMVATLTNGASIGYLPPKGFYDRDLYPVWQSPFAAGCLETLTSAVTAAARKL